MRDATEIVIVADRSASMVNCYEEMISGFNSFIEEQKKEKKPCNVSLTIFDDKIENVYSSLPLESVPVLTKEVYFPRGSTALNDALGSAIDALGERLSSMNEENRPNKIIVVVMTDGQENVSRKYTGEQVRKMVTHQRDKYSWQFMFLGVDIDAYSLGLNYGLHAANIVSTSKHDMTKLYAGVSNTVYHTRGLEGTLSANYNFFSDDDKVKMGDKTVKPTTETVTTTTTTVTKK